MPGNNVPITRITSPNGRWVDFSYIAVNTVPLISQIRDNLIPKLAFWPCVLGACFAVTLVFLY